MSPDLLPLSPGTHLGPYEILAPLGAGGMGEVYRARDARLERDVALKVLPAAVGEDPERLQRFEREAKALAALNHPSIVTVHSVEEADGVRFLTMELVEGKTLDQVVPAGGLPIDRFFALAIPLAGAVAAAHAHGVIHRDVKPANVMVTEDGRVKVLDFGLARRDRIGEDEAVTALPTEGLEELTRRGQVLGTMPYMAPEQLQGRPVSPRSDIFSLGAVLYEMATGRRPFTGESGAELVSSILRDRPPALFEVRPGLPRQLGRIIARCLEKGPERRFQTALDVRNELDSLREEVLSGATESEAPAVPARGARRRQLLLAALAILGLTAGLLLLRWLLAPPEAAVGGDEIDSVAVLPFENMTGDPEMSYLSDGIAAMLLNRLATVGDLRVIPRSVAFRYREPEVDPLKIGKELGVRGVVTGRIDLLDDRVIVEAELTDAAEMAQLWGEIYTPLRGDLVELQSELAADIARELRLRLEPEEVRQVAKRLTDDPEAYELYLKAEHAARVYKFDREVLEHALRLALQATERDPGLAQAHATVARIYAYLGLWNLRPQTEALPQAQQAASRALEIEPDLAEALAVLGFARALLDWDWREGYRQALRALELDPDDLSALTFGAMLSLTQGKTDEAVRLARRAYELDPLDRDAVAMLAWALYQARRFQEAAEFMDKLLELDPDAPFAHRFRGMARAYAGQYEEALAHERTRLAENEDTAWTRNNMAVIHALQGQMHEAERIVAEMPPHEVAADTWAYLGEEERAFAVLEEMVEKRWSNYLMFLPTGPGWDPLRDDPRFDDVLRRVNLQRATPDVETR